MATKSSQKIILAENAPLLNEMLKHILSKTSSMEVVQEFHDLEKMPSGLADGGPDWLVISLSSDQDTPAWIDEYSVTHPETGILILAADDSHIKVKWSELHERKLDDPSLNQLISILRGHP